MNHESLPTVYMTVLNAKFVAIVTGIRRDIMAATQLPAPPSSLMPAIHTREWV
jgi:hypothetical protein